MKQINSFIFDVHLEDFQSSVLQRSHETPILVDFWADWCGPCITVAPVLNRVVESFQGQVLLAKLEVDEGDNMKLAGRYKVRGFPTIILFRDGKEQDRFSSARPAHFIAQFITQQL